MNTVVNVPDYNVSSKDSNTNGGGVLTYFYESLGYAGENTVRFCEWK